MLPPNSFSPGRHRPVYLWAGAGTIRMNQLKFMGAPVDKVVHLEAHTPTGARRMAIEAAFDWAYLTYDWGFPPEIEQEDWQAFRQAADIYHAAGMRLFGYIQTSNYVWEGSFRLKDWYAHDPRGRPFYYYTGRYMACWRHPEWRAHLRAMVLGVIEAGADGVFFDNPWHASQVFLMGGAWLGAAGCFCPRCRLAYRLEIGSEIPLHLSPGQETTDRYLRWRVDHVTQTLAELAGYARAIKPDILVSVNDFDVVMRPSYIICGIDLAALAKIQDVLMIEDYGLPRWENKKHSAPLLVNNALTLRTARALAAGTPVSTDPYDKGIGFDDVYPPRRFQQGIAEAAACEVAMVVKGTEFVADGQFTLLTSERYAPQREAIGKYHRWLEEHASLYENRQNMAEIGLLYPGPALQQDWGRMAPRYFAAGQTLTAANLPWMVVTEAEKAGELHYLLTFGQAAFSTDSENCTGDFAKHPGIVSCSSHKTIKVISTQPSPGTGIKVIDVLRLPGWGLQPPSFLRRKAWLSRLIAPPIIETYRAYFRFRWARRLLDRLGMVHFFLQSPYFILPPQEMQQSLLTALGVVFKPQVQGEAPLLVEHWRQGRQEQFHLVNYATHPQRLTVDFGRNTRGEILSPDGAQATFNGTQVNLVLDVYTVLLY